MKVRLSRIRTIASKVLPFLVFAVLLGLAEAQTAKTASKAPSPELVGDLTKQLSITPAQATGGVGALFGFAKSRLGAADFSKVAAVVPGMNGFLKAAPSAASYGGGLPGVSTLSGALPAGKLGLSPNMVGKFVPVLTQFVQSKGGAGVASLLSGVLSGGK